MGTMRANSVIQEFVKAEWIKPEKGLFEMTPVGRVRYEQYMGLRK
jgi:hypothetical protein